MVEGPGLESAQIPFSINERELAIFGEEGDPGEVLVKEPFHL